MALKFGDPQSIEERDRARVEAEKTQHECATCDGNGQVQASFMCAERDTCGLSLHFLDVSCPCCRGRGEVDDVPEDDESSE